MQKGITQENTDKNKKAYIVLVFVFIKNKFETFFLQFGASYWEASSVQEHIDLKDKEYNHKYVDL